MKKEVLISIKGTQLVDGEKDQVELLTTGSYYRRGGHYYIAYDESEVTGFEGSHTVLKVEEDKRVTMLRSGSVQSHLIVENGVRHQCNYQVGGHSLIIGVSGASIVSSLTDQGGDLAFKYSLDINTTLTSENEIRIQVTECGTTPEPV